MCIFRWQTILTRVSPPSQKTIYNFKLVVGHTTKHMKHGRSCDFEISVPSCDIFNLWFIIFQCIISTVNSYHGLRGSASPVLTATAWPCKWEMEIFDPHRIHTLNRPPKNLSQVITSATPTSMPHLVEIRSWGLLGKWVKYNDFYLFASVPFIVNSPTYHTRRRFFTCDDSNDVDTRRVCLLG